MVCVTTAGTPTPLPILPFNPFQNCGDAAYRPAVATVGGVPTRCWATSGIGWATMAPASVLDTSLLAATSGEEQLVGAAVPGRRETGVRHGAEAYGCRCGPADADHRTRCGGDRFS
jgi:hypothetical protein